MIFWVHCIYRVIVSKVSHWNNYGRKTIGLNAIKLDNLKVVMGIYLHPKRKKNEIFTTKEGKDSAWNILKQNKTWKHWFKMSVILSHLSQSMIKVISTVFQKQVKSYSYILNLVLSKPGWMLHICQYIAFVKAAKLFRLSPKTLLLR